MARARHGRRAFLTAAAAVGGGLASVGQASATDLENACSRGDGGQQGQTVPIDPIGPTGSIDVTIAESGVSGPTACIVGGIHGDEEAGISAAHTITTWTPDAGMLVVVPEANPVAIENNTRAGKHGDLNRKFVHGQQPTSELAQSLWQAVTAADPDLLITLQESRGIYGGASPGVGQAIFRSAGENTADAARLGQQMANRTIGRQTFTFSIGRISGPQSAPNGLLSEKAAYEAGIPSFIVETYEGIHQTARVHWQKKAVIGILNYYDLYE